MRKLQSKKEMKGIGISRDVSDERQVSEETKTQRTISSAMSVGSRTDLKFFLARLLSKKRVCARACVLVHACFLCVCVLMHACCLCVFLCACMLFVCVLGLCS